MSGVSGPDIVPPPTETKASGDGEGEENASTLESIEVKIPVGVRERPRNYTHIIGLVSPQHGGGRRLIPVVPENNTPRRSNASFGSRLEENDLRVRIQPPTSGSPRCSNMSLRPEDETRGRSSVHTTRTGDWAEGTSLNGEAAPSSQRRQNDACDETGRVGYQDSEKERCCAEDDTRILQEIRAASYQDDIVRLISPQRPGVLGCLDRVTGTLTGRQESLTDADFGYRIHFGDLQRLHIQYLHSKVVNLAVSSHFDDSEWSSGGKAEKMGQVLKEYSKSSFEHHLKAAAY